MRIPGPTSSSLFTLRVSNDRVSSARGRVGIGIAPSMLAERRKHRLIWRLPLSSRRWTQISHVAVGHWRLESIQVCRSFWSTLLDSDHALVRTPFFRLDFCHTRTEVTFQHKCFPSKRLMTFLSQLNVQGPSEHWKQIKESVHLVASTTRDSLLHKPQKRWLSLASVALLDAHISVPPNETQ